MKNLDGANAPVNVSLKAGYMKRGRAEESGKRIVIVA
jgi:hypothetical protein